MNVLFMSYYHISAAGIAGKCISSLNMERLEWIFKRLKFFFYELKTLNVI